MSLNKEQRRITCEELQAHFEESTLSVQMIAEKLNVTHEFYIQIITRLVWQFCEAMHLKSRDPGIASYTHTDT